MRLQLTMSKSEMSHEKAQKTQRMKKGRAVLGAFCAFLWLVCIGCRRDMQDQPKVIPLRGATFFSDGLGSRQPIEGTIPRGYLRDDVEFYTGKKAGAKTGSATTAQQQIANPQQPAPNANSQTAGAAQQNSFPDDIVDFPIAINKDVLRRGQERYNIFCSVCHGMTGNGDGMIVRRGYRRAASFNDDRLRQAPVGHFFDAMTNGWGAMPSYAPQIPVQDRWAIVAYIRALQASQQNTAAAAASPAPSPSPTPAAGGHQ